MKTRIFTVLATCIASMGIQPVLAVEGITFSGYMTLKGTYTDAVKKSDGVTATKYGNSYASKNVDFDTHGNHVGLQASAEVTDDLDMTMVLQAHGGHEKYAVKVEWVYASYTISDEYTLRVGRIKGPFFMVSEYKEVGYAYPWVTPPKEVYSTNPIESVSGLNMVYQTELGNWDWLFEVYAGSGKNEATAQANVAEFSGVTKGTKVDFTTNNMVGFNTTIGTQGVSFRAGYFTTKVDVDPSIGMIINDEMGSFGGIGMIIDWRNLLVYSEYIIRDTEDSQHMRMAFPDQKAGYITLGYRLGDFTPYFTAAMMDKGSDPSIFALKQSSFTLGFRYEAGPTAAIKFEATQIKPDADAGDYGGAYGLFDDPVKNNKGNVIAASFDLIF